jgi:hypothetical protein
MIKAKKQPAEISATAIYRLTSKIDGKECYAVPSDTTSGSYYRVCWSAEDMCWTCSCKHGEFCAHRGENAQCKHARAVQTSIIANKEAREAKEAERAQAMAELAEEMAAEDFYEEQKAERMSYEVYCALFDPCGLAL